MTKSISDWQREITAWGESKGWDKPALCETKSVEISAEHRATVREHLGSAADTFFELLPKRTEPQGVNVDAVGMKLALIHSEISEALEALREGKIAAYDKDGKPEGMTTEIADAIIRALHLGGLLGLDIEDAIERKMAYNEKRPYRHGGKLA